MASKMFRGQFGVALIPDVIKEARALEAKYKEASKTLEDIQIALKDLEIRVQTFGSVALSMLDGKGDEERKEVEDKYDGFYRENVVLLRRYKKAAKKIVRTRHEIRQFLTDMIGFEAADVGEKVHQIVANRLDRLAGIAGIY